MKQGCAQNRGFTLTEIMMVVIIIGILASIALVRYDRTLTQARERDASTQLKVIHAANVLYHSRQGYYMPTGTGDLAAINQGMGLNILAKDLSYQYMFVEKDGVAGPSAQDGYQASVAFFNAQGNALFRLKLTENPLNEAAGAANPCCDTAGTCWTVPDC